MKTDLILKFKQNLYFKVIWSSTPGQDTQLLRILHATLLCGVQVGTRSLGLSTFWNVVRILFDALLMKSETETNA